MGYKGPEGTTHDAGRATGGRVVRELRDLSQERRVYEESPPPFPKRGKSPLPPHPHHKVRMAWLLPGCCLALTTALFSSARPDNSHGSISRDRIAQPGSSSPAYDRYAPGRCLERSKAEIAVVIVRIFSIGLPISGAVAMPLLHHTPWRSVATQEGSDDPL